MKKSKKFNAVKGKGAVWNASNSGPVFGSINFSSCLRLLKNNDIANSKKKDTGFENY